jgi:hypothetical protein
MEPLHKPRSICRKYKVEEALFQTTPTGIACVLTDNIKAYDPLHITVKVCLEASSLEKLFSVH